MIYLFRVHPDTDVFRVESRPRTNDPVLTLRVYGLNDLRSYLKQQGRLQNTTIANVIDELLRIGSVKIENAEGQSN